MAAFGGKGAFLPVFSCLFVCDLLLILLLLADFIVTLRESLRLMTKIHHVLESCCSIPMFFPGKFLTKDLRFVFRSTFPTSDDPNLPDLSSTFLEMILRLIKI